MNWTNVRLIHVREIRDQLRDRRTLFMIAVLPILLYPLLGMTFFQIAQFRHEKPTTVVVVGARPPADLPPLLADHHFAESLCLKDNDANRFEVRYAAEEFADNPQSLQARGGGFAHDLGQEFADGPQSLLAAAKTAVEQGKYDAVLYFPDDFFPRLSAMRKELAAGKHAADATLPEAGEFYTKARDSSCLAFIRLRDIMQEWIQQIGESNLKAHGLPPTAAKPVGEKAVDLAAATGRVGLAGWSKILPVLLLVWALTGAFYPAIDLCAGEKERGTLETLLSSPAERSEIVMGKLLTIMVFSMVTAALNLASMAVTGWLILGQIAGFGPPPPLAALWLAIALVPVAALFSALALALAAFARGTKEGQYYLMPLLLVTMPLAILPATPSVELNLGNSLIPVTGIVLLLKSLLEGSYWLALQYAAPVVGVTLILCLLSIRWAVDQFNSESVLFRESERLDVGHWLQHTLRDRQTTPTVAAAMFCAVVILMARFFLGFAVPPPHDFHSFAVQALVSQIAVILAPTLLMTVMLTKSPRQTLLLQFPRPMTTTLATLAAVPLALALHPVATGLGKLVDWLYPLSDQIKAAVERMHLDGGTWWQTVLVIGIVPAVCEELAFRGFILSGFRHLGHKWRAIFYSALFFGLTHAILQQSLTACLLGMVIAFIAVQTNSLLPGMVFHMCHNSFLFLAPKLFAFLDRHAASHLLGRWYVCLRDAIIIPGRGEGEYSFHWYVAAGGFVVAALILAWFQWLPAPKTPEEELQEAIDRGSKAHD